MVVDSILRRRRLLELVQLRQWLLSEHSCGMPDLVLGQQVAVGWLPSLAVPTTTVTVWATYEYLENTNQRFL